MRYMILHAYYLIIIQFWPSSQKIKDVPTPTGYTRSASAAGSFALWLKEINLKKDPTVYLYNGQKKRNQSAQYVVLDMPVGHKDLQQCADAVMRLRAEYLYEKGRFDEIVFYDNLHRAYRFTTPYTRSHFEKYLENVFAWCGTASLEKQLKAPAKYTEVQAGDVFIHGGSPGHAIIVMDIAVNRSGEQVFLLAQSYMPAQDIHLLKNNAYPKLGPWFTLPVRGALETPEWTFKNGERKQW